MEESNIIYELCEKINTRSDFEKFLEELRYNYATYKSDVWDNHTLEAFLEGLYGFNYQADNDKPSWKLFARILLAARVYE
ncbi:hypothetical protein [Flavobacterium sp. NRK1]|uniref:DUF7660 family protein n=1 Tax=Flavobacterium sp. NRK1 TaxID=2954929 RepID=UPI0020929DEC|nr:hypothetical protein [Flavobacterium sp. NRK1]MCO6148855.1 hypothetical protein [Flavobacterium sp. NRK1]